MEKIRPNVIALSREQLETQFLFLPSFTGIPLPKLTIFDADPYQPYLQQRLQDLHRIIPRLTDEITAQGTSIPARDITKLTDEVYALTQYEVFRPLFSDPIRFDLAQDVMNLASSIIQQPNSETEAIFRSASICISAWQFGNFTHQQKAQLLATGIPILVQADCLPQVFKRGDLGVINVMSSIFHPNFVNGQRLDKDDRLKLSPVILTSVIDYLKHKPHIDSREKEQIVEIIINAGLAEEYTNQEKASLLPDVYKAFHELLSKGLDSRTLYSIITLFDSTPNPNEIGPIVRIILSLPPKDPNRKKLETDALNLLDKTIIELNYLNPKKVFVNFLPTNFAHYQNFQLNN